MSDRIPGPPPRVLTFEAFDSQIGCRHSCLNPIREQGIDYCEILMCQT
jgi:hypothetical protein